MKATPDDYQPRPMGVLCQAALEILRDANGQGLRCGLLGDRLFPDAILRGSAPFARIAGKVMHRLDSAGLATWCADDYGGWVITRKGQSCDYSS